jgi:hypothetical protein
MGAMMGGSMCLPAPANLNHASQTTDLSNQLSDVLSASFLVPQPRPTEYAGGAGLARLTPTQEPSTSLDTAPARTAL